MKAIKENYEPKNEISSLKEKLSVFMKKRKGEKITRTSYTDDIMK